MKANIIERLFIKQPAPIARFKILQSSEHMTRIILISTFGLDIVLITLFLFSVLILGRAYMVERIMIGVIILIYLGVVSFFIYKKYIRFGAWLLVILYGLIGLLVLHMWGINSPIGILVMGFVILLSGVMLGAKYIIIITTAVIASLIFLQYFNIIGVSNPDLSALNNSSSFEDVVGYSIIFSIFAVVSWLSGTRMESTLERATTAETALAKERDRLVTRVDQQTKSLKAAQQKELKQLYRFAELGQLTTIILHELANYLSVLTLDIDDLQERHQNSIAIEHAKESIFYIDNIIEQVRNQIKDSDSTQKFDALTVIKESLEQLRKKVHGANIKLFIEDDRPKNYLIFGDPLRLSQAITILVTNAVQANTNKYSEIAVDVSSIESKIIISVKDFGTGITPETRRTLFHPQKSKKGAGMGIGLYVTKQIIETHFKGRIRLNPATEYTQFTIEIPRIKR